MDELKEIAGGGLPEVLEQVKALQQPKFEEALPRALGGGSAPYLVLPNGMRIESLQPLLDEWIDAPRRQLFEMHMDDLDSFIEAVNQFKQDSTIVYCEDTGRRDATRAAQLVARFDHFTKDQNSFVDGKAFYKFPVSEEWKTWFGQNGKPMAQVEFARFLEDRVLELMPKLEREQAEGIYSVADAMGAEIAGRDSVMAVAASLQVKINGEFEQATRLASGEYELTSTEKHEATVKVPSLFAIQIPVFENGPGYLILVRLRYRVSREDGVQWLFELHDGLKIMKHAIDEVMERVRKETSLPVWVGDLR